VTAAPRHSRLTGSAIGDYIEAHLSSFYQILLMASFIPFLVYFMLSWRDHINRSFLQLVPRRSAAGGGAQPAGNRRDGAGVRGGQLSAGVSAGESELGDVLMPCACRTPCWWGR
jgi:hypothetical protein